MDTPGGFTYNPRIPFTPFQTWTVAMKDLLKLNPGQAACLILMTTLLLAGPLHADQVAPSSGWYGGLIAGSAWLDNEIEDVEGFANWGLPGWTLDVHDSGLVAGVLGGRAFGLAGVPLHLEVDALLGDMKARSMRLDPQGLDETVEVEVRWVATARVGAEHTVGNMRVFASTGMAIAGVDRSVTDIDSGPNIDPYFDADDSFDDHTTEVGWVFGAGLSTHLARSLEVRLEGLYMDFGTSTHYVNHSGNNRCGPGGPQRPCPYKFDNELGLVRLGLTYRFDG